jgi:hypothetical protein
MQIARKELGLGDEAIKRTVVPDNVIGSGDLDADRHLGGNDFFRDFVRHSWAFAEPMELGSGRATHRDHAVEARLRVCLKEQRDIHNEKFFGCGRFLRPFQPAVADDRMKNRFEQALLFDVRID